MAVNETKVTKIFVGSTAPTVNKNLIWCDTSKNYQLKKFIGTSNGVDQWKVLAASEASAITIEENGQKYILQDYVLALATELDSKANTSDLSSYLRKKGDTSLTLGIEDYENDIYSRGSLTILGDIPSGVEYVTITGSIGTFSSDIGYTDVGAGTISCYTDADYSNPIFKLSYYDNGITGSLVDTSIPSTPEEGHIVTTGAVKTYVDTSVSNKANASDVVTLTGNQTISGSKTFNNITIDNLNGNTTDVDGIKISTNTNSIELYAAAYTDDSNTPYNNIFTKIDAKKLEISKSQLVSGTESIQIDANNIKFTGEDISFDINAYDGIQMYRGGGYSTNVTSSGILSQNNYGISITSGGNQFIISNIPSHDAVSQLMGHHNLLGGIENTFVGYSIGTGLDLESGDLSNFKNTSILSVGYSIDYTTDEVTPEISGSLVDKTISSSSLDTHIPTSKAVYTSLANKQDKLHYFSEDTTNFTVTFGSYQNLTTTVIGYNVNIGPYETGYGGISVNAETGTTHIKSEYSDAFFDVPGFTGSGIVTSIGTSTTSTKLPTEGAVVKAISDVKTSLGSALTYEGSVENYSNLPTGLTASDKGKVYNVVNANCNIPAGTNYAWNGTSWDALGGDMSAYLRKEGDTSLTLGDKENHTSGELVVSDFICSGTTITSDNVTIGNETSQIVLDAVDGIELQDNDGNNTLNLKHDGISGSLVDTTIPSTPEEGHIATTGAIKTYVDNSTSNKVEKNSDAELNAFIMPTYNSSGVQNGKAKIILYKDDTTGAITIEVEEIVE